MGLHGQPSSLQRLGARQRAHHQQKSGMAQNASCHNSCHLDSCIIAVTADLCSCFQSRKGYEAGPNYAEQVQGQAEGRL